MQQQPTLALKRITVTTKDLNDKEYKLQSQARIVMQDPLNFVP